MKRKLLICIFFLCASNFMIAQNYFPSTGNVGIGTGSSPAAGANLHVRSTANYPRVAIQSTSATGAPGISLGGNSSPFTWTMHYDISNQFLGFFYEGVGNRMVLKSSGKLCIGTIDPKTTLDVGGNLRLGSIADMPAEGSVAGVLMNFG